MGGEEILRAAAEFLGRRPNATQDEIAEAAGVSRATLHRHFAGRKALLEAIDALAVRELRQVLAEARLDEGTAGEALTRLIVASEPVSPFLSLLYSQSQAFETDEIDGDWIELDEALVALFRRGQEAGEFRTDLSAAWFTDALFGLVASAGWSVKVGRSAARDYAAMLTGLLLDGVRR
ncbi:AcrR family transcriptional regulator [Actinoplanes octamycinicus]|uniref:AcrR family transcriptional regulator n=1 Tax=Actinoplanes octamycinicus TaxID=135948 RepID=A0A7W7M8N8_9ACTN|nr:TetR/AcrR family transcriptional regulator [Actinoplanes octamycinicus]MBB4741122.1 AcrR family transcriptional regulator [Actinoplanes octamycinicus]GIE56029.1 TetR family transcriptional regulator [Actinoplanes octamycinicus]